ncbi:MAG: hypothetical protein FWD17_14695 [Polyangiaceae bacterium]|nr:hypothetical protein [Polyangiaceae bacterium]
MSALRLFGADAARALCAAGHPAERWLKTKAFDRKHDRYYVFEGQLYVRANEEGEGLVPSMEGGDLVLSRRVTTSPVDITIKATVSADCVACDPVVFEREGFFYESVAHTYVSCKWNLFFERGRLTRVEAVTLETRESLRRKMLGDAEGVLPDDGRIAKRHVQLLREGRRLYFW